MSLFSTDDSWDQIDEAPACTEAFGWMAAGAGLMYLFDPKLGRRRRHVLQDKLVSYCRQACNATDATARDVWHRGSGVVHEARASLAHEEVSDEVLVQRVRATLGRVVSHPHAIHVTATAGHVTLAGHVLAAEAAHLIRGVRSVRGVKDVANHLQVHEHAGRTPELQGGLRRRGERPDVMQENWSPTTRLLAAAIGTVTGLYGLSRGGVLGLLPASAGAGLLLRAATNLEAKRLVGAGGGRRGIDIHKVINIAAPVEEVWSFWSNYDNFPLWMRNVREVRQHANGSSHWVVAGPAGVRVEWDAVETARIPGEVLAWKSVPKSAIASAGVVRFQPNEDGSTRVEVKMSYNPPGGAIGHAVAALFGSDPKSEMDEDLARMKTLIEAARFPHDAAQHVGSA